MPTAQEFITKTTQELQDARAMHGDRRSPGAAPHPGEDAGLRVCIDVPGHNRAASQELFWPSHMGRCKGPPHSYVRMPFGLPSVASAYQRNMRESKRLMRGNKWRLFCLQLSFLGWLLLGCLTLGIGLLWVYPYQSAAEAAFYLEITGRRPSPRVTQGPEF